MSPGGEEVIELKSGFGSHRRERQAARYAARHAGGAEGKFDARFADGIDYPLNRRYRFRAGAAYGGNAHLTVGISMRF